MATSIKSVDLTLPGYQKSNTLLSTLKGYINKLDNFTEATRGGINISEGVDFTSKSLEVGIQPGKATIDQWEAISKAMEYGRQQGINVQIRFIN